MGKGQVAGPEGDLPLLGVGVLAVLPVARQGHVAGRELGADLVGAPGLQANFDQREAVLVVQQLVVQDGLLDALAGVFGDVGLAGLLTAAQQVDERPLVILGPPVDNGLIFLQERILPDLPGQLRGGGAGEAVDHQAAHHLVQPVDGADLGLRLADGLPDAVGHPARLVRGEDPEGLDADDDGLVLVNDVEHSDLL